MGYKHEVIFKSDGKTLIMDEKSDMKIIDIKGIEASSYKINTTKSNQDGANISSKKIEARDITITGDIEKNNKEDENRDSLLRFFNPKSSGEMIITRNKVSRRIRI